jgi:hypothetical protein
MTPRERYLGTLLFEKPDRIPFFPGGPRESTLKAWRTQGLPEGVDWFDHLCETIGVERERTKPPVDLGIDLRMIPQFEEKVLEHRDGHYVVQDWKGNVCEIADTFDVTYLRMAKDFVTRRWIRCPVETRDDWERMKERYNPDSPGRLPADLAERAKKAADRDYCLVLGWSAPFWQMREWCGFEGLCFLMVDDPEFADEMAAFCRDFVLKMLDRVLPHVAPDWVQLSEDMAYKEHSMISPAMARRFLKPSYDAWVSRLKEAGCRIVDMDSDGHVGELIPIWIESGINVCDPIEVAAGNDINEFRRRFGRKMAYKGGVDKRAMAKGGRAIRAELKRLSPVVRDGGYIPSCDHGVPSDVSWPNFVDYSRLLAKITGWL